MDLFIASTQAYSKSRNAFELIVTTTHLKAISKSDSNDIQHCLASTKESPGSFLSLASLRLQNSDVAQEIRTLLHAAQALLVKTTQIEITPEASELQLQLDHVTAIVEDFAFVTRCDSGKVLTIRPVGMHMENVIREIYNKLSRSELKNKRIQIEMNMQDVPDDLEADPSLQRVMYHLMSNAMAYSTDNSVIHVELSFTQLTPKDSPQTPQKVHRGRTLRISETTSRRGVFTFKTTNAVGRIMDLEAVHACFQRYYASKPTKRGRGYKGLGVGLNVAFNMVQMMGGMLECSATPTASSFWFSLELSVTPPSISPKPPSKVNELRSGESSFRIDAYPEDTDHEWTSLQESAVANTFVLDELGVGCISPTDYSRKISLQQPSARKLQEGGSVGGTGQGDGTGTSSTAVSRKCRILCVDDNTICQKVLVNTLKRLGIDSDVAGNGKEALGLKLPIIVLTADVGTDGREENAIKAGVDVFLSKPATLNSLKSALKQFNIM
eukprot:gene4300-8548_t